MNVIRQCARKLEPSIKQFLLSAISGDGNAQNSHIDYHDVIYGLYQCAPETLREIIPYLTGELLVISSSTCIASNYFIFCSEILRIGF